MRRVKHFSQKLGDGTFFDGIRGAFPEGFFADLLAQVLMAWIGGCGLPTSGRDAKEMCGDAWSEGRQRYDRGFFRRATLTVREEARDKGERLTKKQLKTVARVALDGVRLGDDDEMSLGIEDVLR